MANTCTIRATAYQGRYMELVCTQTKNDSQNTSTINWTLTVGGGTSNYYTTRNTIVEINGVRVYYDEQTAYYAYRFPAGKGSVSGTLTVPHNNDGSKTISVRLNTAIYTTDTIGETKSWVLDGISRISQMSVAETFTMGSEGTITISRLDSSFKHTIGYYWGDTTDAGISAGRGYKGIVAEQTTATSVKWTPPTKLANLIPHETIGTGTLVCDTYANGVLIGTSKIVFKANVPEYTPTITSFTAERIDNSVPSDWGLYVQGKSQCRLKMTAEGAYGSTITSYSIMRGTTSLSASPEVTTGILNESGYITFMAYVTDSRGRTNKRGVSINVESYSSPNVYSTTCQRCNSDGTVNEDGTCIKASAMYFYNACGGKNTASCRIYYKKSGDTQWSSGVLASSYSDVIITTSADVDSSYDVKFEISDTLETIVITDVVGTSFTTLDFRKGGRGVAIGKASEKDAFECAMDAEFTGAFSANLSGLFVRETFVPDSPVSVNPSTVRDTLFDITKEGYTPLAISGVHTSHGSALLVVAQLESSTQAKVTVRNVNTVAINVAPTVEILFVKTI